MARESIAAARAHVDFHGLVAAAAASHGIPHEERRVERIGVSL